MAGEEVGVYVALIFFLILSGIHLFMVWRLFVAPTTTARGLPEHCNLSIRDLAQVENFIAYNMEPGPGSTEIFEIYPIVADGKYDHFLADQLELDPMNGNIAVDEAEAPLALLLTLGAAVGLQRQIDSEAIPIQEPETDVADADERRMLALASGAGLSRVATVSLGVPAGGLESNLEAEPTVPRPQKADKN